MQKQAARSPTSAAAKVRGSLPWVLSEGIVNIAYGLCMVAIIGIFIRPDELGRAGIATATTLLVEAFTALGLQEGVIRARSGDTLTTDATFALAGASAVLGYSIAVAIALLLSVTMSSPSIIGLTMLAALTIPLNAFAAVPIGILSRKLRTKQLSLRIMASKICSLFTLVVCAVAGLGGEAIVGSFVAAAGASCALVWWTIKRKPKFRPNMRVSKEMLSFGIFVSLENLSWNATVRLFAILFGQFHGMSSLGLLQFAARLTDELASLIQILVARVGLSFFSHIERSGGDIRPTFKTGTLVMLTIATPLFVGIAAVAPLLVPSLFGDRWRSAVPFLQILALSWPFTFARVLISPVLRAKGKTFVYTIGLTTSSCITLGACYLTRDLDPHRAALSYVVAQAFSIPFFAYVAKRYIGVPVGQQLKIALFPVVGGILVWMTAHFVGDLVNQWNNLLFRFAAIIASSATVYLLLTWFNPPVRALASTINLPFQSLGRQPTQ